MANVLMVFVPVPGGFFFPDPGFLRAFDGVLVPIGGGRRLRPLGSLDRERRQRALEIG